MIVRMAKTVVIGPQELLMDTLDLIRHLGILQIEDDIRVYYPYHE